MTSAEIRPSFRICTIAARWASITLVHQALVGERPVDDPVLVLEVAAQGGEAAAPERVEAPHPLDGVLARPLLLGEPVERLERRLGGRDPGGVLLGLLLRAVVDHPQPADQRRQRQPLNDDREQDDAVGEEDHQVALGERRAGVGLERQRERRGERDRAAHPRPAHDHARGRRRPGARPGSGGGRAPG